MYILSFDTTGSFCSVALYKNKTVLASEYNIVSGSQSESLIPMIQRILSKVGLSIKDLHYVAVTNGPGSFTGIRVGLSAAQAFCVSYNVIPCVINTFELYNYRIASQVGDGVHCGIVVLLAYSKRFYVQVFDYLKCTKSSYMLLDIDEVQTLLLKQRGITAVSGTGLSYFQQLFLLEKYVFLPRYIHSRLLAELAFEKISKGGFEKNLSPLYIQEPSINNKKGLV
ncbi:tRNA (adenosine(37)-N6)-threonylcarbamoyltransferase complex dimerization subunit type 1 TsaB [Candidatus Sneabacter namystus]|uniref:tRNA (Adenosine(37)-N6)-threonylcarbamoyltransferase complex dimerization subunit type 1 TsaB n=1 Tax=Candidatus Sneabacter namystus TaxID=2601646 RepID=A0A5C0UJ02_9RICK|nr:tRNA (adenosine(37)-N6)-threonylcarbamoyltransferase complex dimerization subunit type 1 TsaB [Candidatus Sneabacter namystus]QEK39591.1 tRNA (adenosine(37)-N6)-threonylcarbamoyltransferase complex dimerization subunit type 1 TsaB [Candidatus Sneabacter namystus]